MLFGALIERLLGSDETQDWKDRDRLKTSRFSFDNYPSLTTILSGLLDPNGPLKQSTEISLNSSSPLDLHGAEGVFPALQILRQARPPEPTLQPILKSVELLLASPHWHLRDMAARTVVSMRSTSQLHKAGLSLLRVVPRSQNEKHGTLLAVKYLLRKLFSEPTYLSESPTKNYSGLSKTLTISDLQEFDSLMRKLIDSSVEWYISSDSPFVRSTFLQVVSLCGIGMLQRPDASSILHIWVDLASSLSLGPQFDLGIHVGYGNALFMTTLTQVFIVDRLIMLHHSQGTVKSSGEQSIGDALRMLATTDPDTCCAALDSLDILIRMKSSNALVDSSAMILTYIQELLLSTDEPEVLSAAQALLTKALTDTERRADFLSQLAEEEVITLLGKLEAQCLDGSPSNMQSALCLLGFVVDFAYQAYSHQDQVILKAIARLICLLRMAIIDTNPFDMRFAAVNCVCAIDSIWTAGTTSKSTGPLLLGLSLVLLDLLNDDDDEIRQLAASATANLLRAQGNASFQNTVPLLSTHRLAIFLSKAFSPSAHLIREAIRRLTDTSPPTPLFQVPFAQTFAAARYVDTALFATEKQNLYKDDTLDAILWSRILSRQHTRSIPQVLRSGLAAWVLNGLDTLTQTAETEMDGPLGWTSKPEVFALGIRIFCAAEVVLAWEQQDMFEADCTRSHVLKALRHFVDVGMRAEVHPLWLQRIESLLEKQVLHTLKVVSSKLQALEAK